MANFSLCWVFIKFEKINCLVNPVGQCLFISWAVSPSAAFWHPLCWGSRISSGCQPTSAVLFYGSVTPRQLACKPPLKKNRYMMFMMSSLSQKLSFSVLYCKRGYLRWWLTKCFSSFKPYAFITYADAWSRNLKFVWIFCAGLFSAILSLKHK